MKFIVPFGAGAGADIGARLFAERLAAKWGQPVVIENRPGGDSIVAIQAFLAANDDHTLLFGPSGNFTVHPFVYSKLSYDPDDLVPIARVSNTILAVAVKADAPYNNVKEFTEAARASARQVQLRAGAGHHRIHLLGLSAPREAQDHAGALSRHQRGAGRSRRRPHPGGDVVACDRAAADSAGRIKLFVVNNKTRVAGRAGRADRARAGLSLARGRRTGRPVRLKTMSDELKEKIAADFRAAAADGSIAERLRPPAR